MKNNEIEALKKEIAMHKNNLEILEFKSPTELLAYRMTIDSMEETLTLMQEAT